jgi:phosphoribosylanthranilate isomerase
VGLIEDENLVAIAGRCIDCALAKVSRVINTVVAGGVNLDNIERSSAIPG